MQLPFRFARSCKAYSDKQHEPKDLGSSGSRITQTIAATCSSGLVLSSAGFGAVYAFQTGSAHGPLLGALTVLFAVALEGVKPLAVAGAFSAFRSFAVVRGLALGVLAIMAIAYSLTAELGLMAQSKGDLAAGRASVVEHSAAIRARVRSAQSELNGLASSRPVADVEASIAKLLAANPKASDCSVMDGPVSRSICPTVAMYRSEIARTERRRELQEIVAKSTDSLATAPAVKSADPGSAALGTYLALLGVTVSNDVLAQWLLLVPVLALEVGAALAVVLVQSVSGTPTVNANARCPIEGVPEPGKSPEIAPNTENTCVPSDQARLKIADSPEERLLQMLRERGGRVFGGQRMFAKALGVSASHINRIMHALAETGQVVLETGKSGTIVKLAA